MENKVIAYLIQAHNNPVHLQKMIWALNSEKVSFFIHIDKKSDILEFTKLLWQQKNIYFVNNRINVIWKWFSQVKATIQTIKLAFKKWNYKYFILLSWADYPIKSNKEILSFFENTNKNYIEHKKIEKSNNYLDYFKNKQLWFKISKWHFYDTLKYNFNSKKWSFKHWLYRLFILFNILIVNTFSKKKKIGLNIDYYFWSQWWCINQESIEYILDFHEKNRFLEKIFYYSDSSDEMYFQTILMNSEFKNICINDNLRYIDWSKNREWPAILAENDFKKTTNSQKLFARKFGKKSKKLINLIDKSRDNGKL